MNNDSSISISWSVEDVESIDSGLSFAQCITVLKYVESTHDASVGINWDVIRAAIERLYGH